MPFLLTLAYLFLTLVPPAEIHPSLAKANLMDVLGVAAIGGGLLGVLISRKRREVPAQLLLVVGLLLWAALSVVLTLRWFGGAFFTLQSLTVNFGLFWLLALTVDNLRRLALVRGVLLATLAVLVVMGILDLRTGAFDGRFVMLQGRDAASEETPAEDETLAQEPGQRLQGRRLMALGYLADPNQFAQILVAVLPLFLVGWRSSRLIGNLFVVILPAALFVYGIVLTGSRGGLVALGALVAAAALLQRRRWLSRATAAAVLAAVPLALLVARRTAQQDDSAAGRMEAWSYGLQLLKGSPVWGAGFGSFIESHDLTAHNSFVLCFAELGLVGYFLWLSIFVVCFIQLSQVARWSPDNTQGWHVRRWAAAARLSMVAFLTAGFFLSRTFSVMLFLLVGIATAVVTVAKESGCEIEALRPRRVSLRTAGIEIFSIVAIYLSMRFVR